MIGVSYLLSYDYNYFFTSVKQLYPYVAKIVVAIDSDRLTWSGNKFEIPQSFFEDVKKFDTRNIIEFYFDKFYIAELSPMECENRERNLALAKLINYKWKVQLDVDEYIYDFAEIVKYLEKHCYLAVFPKLTPVLFKGKLITIFKTLDSGYLYIDNKEQFNFITNQNQNSFVRNNDKCSSFKFNAAVIHQSWARDEEEIWMKVQNWGHKNQFDAQRYISFWNGLNLENYKSTTNFHPLSPAVWDKLHYIEAVSIDDFIYKYSQNHPQQLEDVSIKLLFKTLKRKISAKFSKITKGHNG